MLEIHSDHVDGCFRGPVAVVAARTVVLDRADPAGYDGNLGAFVKIVDECLGNPQRAERVDAVLFRHGVVVDVAERITQEDSRIIDEYVDRQSLELLAKSFDCGAAAYVDAVDNADTERCEFVRRLAADGNYNTVATMISFST